MKVENKIIKKILKKYETIWALESSASLLHWDLSTYMPKKASEERGIALSKLELINQRLFISKSFTNLIKIAEKENLNDLEKGIIRNLKNSLKTYEKVPSKFLEKYNKHIIKSQMIWQEAKLKKDFKKYAKYLEKTFNFNIQIAEYIKENEKNIYDVLLDKYEEGFTTKDADNLFLSVKKPLIELINYVYNSKKYNDVNKIELEKYNKENMVNLNNAILDKIGFDKSRQRIDISAHPFTTTISKNDVRITTWYNQNDFKESLLATIHEFGHSLYERNISNDLTFMPVQTGVSLGIHESQSRFWENMIARDLPFIESNKNLLIKYLPFLRNYSTKDIYNYFNHVKKGCIRVKADELNYNMHIILRYEIERDLINQKISVMELPEIWNEKSQNMLFCNPKNDAEGVLQDVHWAFGSIGYFPTYTIGTLFASQLKHIYNQKHNLENEIRVGNYKDITNWLKENIHKYGAIYKPKDLIKKSFNTEFNSKYFIDYVRKKYKEIY